MLSFYTDIRDISVVLVCVIKRTAKIQLVFKGTARKSAPHKRGRQNIEVSTVIEVLARSIIHVQIL